MLLSDIGEGSGGLFCLTDRTQCCSTAAGGERRGAWRFPNGNEISTTGAIYRSRSYSSVILNKGSSAMEPTGVYMCVIPDKRNVVRNLHLGLFNDYNEGEQMTPHNDYDNSTHRIAAIAITGNRIFLLGERSRLMCSTPVPVESIQWLDQTNRVVMEGTSVLELVLELTIATAHNNTRYTCRVRINGVAMASKRITISITRKMHQL